MLKIDFEIHGVSMEALFETSDVNYMYCGPKRAWNNQWMINMDTCSFKYTFTPPLFPYPNPAHSLPTFIVIRS